MVARKERLGEFLLLDQSSSSSSIVIITWANTGKPVEIIHGAVPRG